MWTGRLGWTTRTYGATAKQRDRRKILQRIIGQIPVEALVHGELSGESQHDRVAVGRGFRDLLHADIAAGTANIFHQNALAKALAHLVSEAARHDVGSAAGRIWHDKTDRPIRIVRCPRMRRDKYQRGDDRRPCGNPA